MSGSLVELEKFDMIQVFGSTAGIDPLLLHVQDEVDKFEPDLSTAASRARIASIAHNVARSKTLIDDAGKKLVSDRKAFIKKVDATRKHARDILDNMKAEVRKPLTDWEEAEEKRQAALQEKIDSIRLRMPMHGAGSQELREALALVEAIRIEGEFDDREDDAETVHLEVMDTIRVRLEEAEKSEADQAELERLRDEEAERTRLEIEKRKSDREEIDEILEKANEGTHQGEQLEPVEKTDVVASVHQAATESARALAHIVGQKEATDIINAIRAGNIPHITFSPQEAQ